MRGHLGRTHPHAVGVGRSLRAVGLDQFGGSPCPEAWHPGVGGESELDPLRICGIFDNGQAGEGREIRIGIDDRLHLIALCFGCDENCGGGEASLVGVEVFLCSGNGAVCMECGSVAIRSPFSIARCR